jgi:hypothetical protein
MTANWARQTLAQDLIDVTVVFPLLAVLALIALRRSPVALIVWLGVLVSIVYSYVIYAFAIPFGPLHLMNTAVLGMSGWALAGGLVHMKAAGAGEWFDDRVPTRSTAAMLIVTGVAFYLLWLSEDVPAAIRGVAPESLREVGLLTNPVHVLDMAFLLPASIVSGVALLGRRRSSYWIPPVLLAAFVAISAGIIAISVLAARAGDESAMSVALGIGLLGSVQLVLLIRYLLHLKISADGLRALDR